MPTALVQAAAQAAALATEKKKSGAFSVASSSASMRSVRSTASKEITSSNLRESVAQEVEDVVSTPEKTSTSEQTISPPSLEAEPLREAQKVGDVEVNEKDTTSAEAAVKDSAADVSSVTEPKADVNSVVPIADVEETVTRTPAKEGRAC